MLYQPQTSRQIVVKSLQRVFAMVGAALAEFRQTSSDTAYLDRLNARELADLGLRRMDDDRNRRLY